MPVVTGTVVVTGASRGIGLEMCKQLLAHDSVKSVIAAVRNPEGAKELQALAQTSGSALHITKADVSNPASLPAWAEKVKAVSGHVDLLINNAGIAQWTSIDSVTPQSMLDCFQTNTMGPLFVVQSLLQAGLLGGDSASTVANVTSKVGSVADNSGGQGYAYRASKSALNNINKSMSIDLAGRNISAVLLHPGWVNTDMTSHGGLIDTDESVSGMLGVLQSDMPLNGHFYDYKREEIPW